MAGKTLKQLSLWMKTKESHPDVWAYIFWLYESLYFALTETYFVLATPKEKEQWLLEWEDFESPKDLDVNALAGEYM